MKQWIALMLIVLLPITATGDGLLPNLDFLINGIPMISLGSAVHRYPDSETKLEDGSTEQYWNGITETEFDAFSVYLSQTGASLGNYTFSDGILEANIVLNEQAFIFRYDTAQRTAWVVYPAGTYDERANMAERKYKAAMEQMSNGEYEQAYATLTSIEDYQYFRDVENLITGDGNLAAVSIAQETVEDSFVLFGHYEQDNNAQNNMEAIEWMVLDVQDNKALLISRYGLDAKPYHEEFTNVTWKTSTLRAWLNNEFFNKAFTGIEQNAVLSFEAGGDVQDKVFLLSGTEIGEYSHSDEARICVPTNYAMSQGAWSSYPYEDSAKAVGWWWLRSPCRTNGYAGFTYIDGSVLYNAVTDTGICIRPAIWINLDDSLMKYSRQKIRLIDARQDLESAQQDLEDARTTLAARETEIAAMQLRLDQQEEFRNQAARIDSLVGLRTRIIQSLSVELRANNINATVDPSTGDIILESAIFFDPNKNVIKNGGKRMLDTFLPVYLSVLLSDEYRDYVGEIIIEGHTDSSGSERSDGYIASMKLSQNRALAVTEYCLSIVPDSQRALLQRILTAKGRSYNDLVYKQDKYGNWVEDQAASRRVEFKFSLKDAEMIAEMNRILNEGGE